MNATRPIPKNTSAPSRLPVARELRAAALRARAAQGAVTTVCDLADAAAVWGPPIVALLSHGEPPRSATTAVAVAKAVSAGCRAQAC